MPRDRRGLPSSPEGCEAGGPTPRGSIGAGHSAVGIFSHFFWARRRRRQASGFITVSWRVARAAAFGVDPAPVGIRLYERPPAARPQISSAPAASRGPLGGRSITQAAVGISSCRRCRWWSVWLVDGARGVNVKRASHAARVPCREAPADHPIRGLEEPVDSRGAGA